MAHNLLTKAQLGFFYQNRKKLDDAIGQILGPGVHLHDISKSSDKSADNSSNSYQQRNPEKLLNSDLTSAMSKNLNLNIAKKTQKYTSNIFETFNTNISENRVQKLYKQNMQLQKKIMSLKDENQQYKHKSLLWEKIKQYIVVNANRELNLQSVKFGSSDSTILEQFLKKVEELLLEKINKIKNTLQLKDNILLKDQNFQIKDKLQEQTKIITRLYLQIDDLRNQNILLKDKERISKKQRKSRIDLLEEGIQEKFTHIQKSLSEKTQENTLLQNKIATLQTEISQLRTISSPLRKNRTISTHPETTAEISQIELTKKISRVKDDQINILKKQARLLTDKVDSLTSTNQKMKKVINLAQSLNNQFLNKLEDSLRKSKSFTQNQFNDYGQLHLSSTQKQNEEDFHFVNKRFKIVKSRSVEKQRYMYGQKNKERDKK